MRKATRIALTAIAVLSAAIGIYSIFMVIKENRENKEDIKAFDDLYESVVINNTSNKELVDAVTPNEITVPEGATDAEKTSYTLVDLDLLRQKNPDCVGWIQIADTVINYPVMHTPSEPSRYLYKNFYLRESRAGVPFLEGGCRLDGDNVIIYAHNMLNGTMFAQLKKYLDYGYIEKNSSVYMQTEEGLLVYEIFAVCHIKNNDVWYSYRVESEEADFNYLIGHLIENADYSTKNIPSFGDRLITLSTCHGKSDDDRLVVVGKLIEIKELS